MKNSVWIILAAFLLSVPCALHAESEFEKFMSGADVTPSSSSSQQNSASTSTQMGSAAAVVLEAPAESGTPQATAAIAAAAKFIDIAGIKLGMPVKKAQSAIKKVNRKFEITLTRLTSNWDNLAHMNEDTSVNLKKRWLVTIQGEVKKDNGSGETMVLSLTDPPNAQVVSNISRQITFPTKSRPHLDKIISGLRTKYGPESLGPDVSDAALTSTFEAGSMATLLWFFDSQGSPLHPSEATTKWYKEKGRNCFAVGQLSYDFSGETPTPVTSSSCVNAVVLQAQINHPARPGVSEIGWKLVSDITVTATHYPLESSSVQATAVWIAEARKNQEKKQTQDAERVKTPKF